MAARSAEVELTKASSYMVADGYGSDWAKVSKEECYFSFNTSWRGKPAYVSMIASRYTAHDSSSTNEGGRVWTDWHLYVSDAREDHAEPGMRSLGANLTDTAKSRLREVCEPVAREWLKSSAYTKARKTALADVIKRTLRDATTYGDSPTRQARLMLEEYATELTAADRKRLTKAADLYDRFVKEIA
jgi:hypothetical protein